MLTWAFIASVASAACDPWSPAFEAAPARGAGSSSLRYAWAALESCDAFEFSHYRVCWNAGALGSNPPRPETPDEAGASCTVVSHDRGRTRASEVVHRSNTVFTARLFACGDEACTRWYGDAEDAVTLAGDTARARTHKERWVIGAVSGYADPTRLVVDTQATAATGFVYPEGFPDAGHLAVWYSTGASGRQSIRYMASRNAGWAPWNDDGASFYPPRMVADSAGSGGVFSNVTHPWAVPATDGGIPYVRMFLQGDDDGDPNVGAAFQIWSIDSIDAQGMEFGLACTRSSCAADFARCASGELCDWQDDSGDGGAVILEMGATGDAFSAYLSSASHGGLIGDDLDGDGAFDFGAESPSMIFTGAAACYDAPDDLFLGAWDGVSWQVPDDGNACPVPALVDAHDPSAIRLPDGTAKVYMQVGPDAYQVCRLDGGLQDCQPIELAFDDGTPLGLPEPSLAGCSDNFQAFSAPGPGRARHGALLHVMGNGVDCFAAGAGGIVSLELRN